MPNSSTTPQEPLPRSLPLAQWHRQTRCWSDDSATHWLVIKVDPKRHDRVEVELNDLQSAAFVHLFLFRRSPEGEGPPVLEEVDMSEELLQGPYFRKVLKVNEFTSAIVAGLDCWPLSRRPDLKRQPVGKVFWHHKQVKSGLFSRAKPKAMVDDEELYLDYSGKSSHSDPLTARQALEIVRERNRLRADKAELPRPRLVTPKRNPELLCELKAALPYTTRIYFSHKPFQILPGRISRQGALSLEGCPSAKVFRGYVEHSGLPDDEMNDCCFALPVVDLEYDTLALEGNSPQSTGSMVAGEQFFSGRIFEQLGVEHDNLNGGFHPTWMWNPVWTHPDASSEAGYVLSWRALQQGSVVNKIDWPWCSVNSAMRSPPGLKWFGKADSAAIKLTPKLRNGHEFESQTYQWPLNGRPHLNH